MHPEQAARIGDRFHSLEQHNLIVTTFCGRHVSIATTPMKLLALNEVTPSPRMLVMLAEHQRHQREAERVGGDFLCS